MAERRPLSDGRMGPVRRVRRSNWTDRSRQGAFLDGSRRALTRNRLNSPVTGRFIFRARDGQVLPPLSVVTGCPLPPAFVGAPYVQRFSAVGALSYRWALIADPGASLPAGLTLTQDGSVLRQPGSYRNVRIYDPTDGENRRRRTGNLEALQSERPTTDGYDHIVLSIADRIGWTELFEIAPGYWRPWSVHLVARRQLEFIAHRDCR